MLLCVECDIYTGGIGETRKLPFYVGNWIKNRNQVNPKCNFLMNMTGLDVARSEIMGVIIQQAGLPFLGLGPKFKVTCLYFPPGQLFCSRVSAGPSWLVLMEICASNSPD